jgi:hypothetical protein
VGVVFVVVFVRSVTQFEVTTLQLGPPFMFGFSVTNTQYRLEGWNFLTFFCLRFAMFNRVSERVARKRTRKFKVCSPHSLSIGRRSKQCFKT